MSWNIAIVDDLEKDRQRLEADLLKWFEGKDEITVSCFPDGESLLEAFGRDAFHLIFMDIQMGADKINGIQTAERLREIDPKVLMVFLTTSPEYAFDAFPIHPFDYLIKPYKRGALNRILSEMLRILSEEDPEITVRIARADYQIPLGNIISVLSQGHSVEIRVTEGEPLRSNTNFSQIEADLKKDPRFLTCNRGVLVNMDHVLALTDNTIQMSDGGSYPLRTKGRAELMTAFSQYQITRMKKGI